ncbi:MAG: XdhC family protein [Candidatus Cyclobacteriaceae bacterium M2_1C_046]
MTHELKSILGAFLINKTKGLKSVLATVVKLDGSSYRRPGVRMLIAENGEMTGAVSGGCVEKEIYRRSLEVFQTNKPLLMTYDGRYRLGCEGILYILIEPFVPGQQFMDYFEFLINSRLPINISILFPNDLAGGSNAGSFLRTAEDKPIGFREEGNIDLYDNQLSRFDQTLKPAFRIVIFGAEHDAVQLSDFAAKTGCEVYVIASAKDPKSPKDFPGADKIINTDPASMDVSIIDEQTAVVLMSHNYMTDLSYLLKLTACNPAYVGLLGPAKRREKLLNELIETRPEISDELLDKVHGPAGLNIGAETPQEIAISIISEILSVVRNTKPEALRAVKGSIHESLKV